MIKITVCVLKAQRTNYSPVSFRVNVRPPVTEAAHFPLAAEKK